METIQIKIEKDDNIQPFLELAFALLYHHLKEIVVYKIKTTQKSKSSGVRSSLPEAF